MDYDAIIVGAGPAGASCAAFCAAAGLRVLVAERAVFPRDKVCGDCLNPDCWPTLARLGVEDALRALPHTALRTVEFAGLRGSPIRLPLPDYTRGEIAVKRSLLDALLLQNAVERGADVRQGEAVSEVNHTPDGFRVGRESTRFLVAADGRNSLVSRSLKLLDDRRRPATDRIGLQTHAPCPTTFGPRVQMRWFARGYGGLCPVGGGELNISLAGPPDTLDSLKNWAREEFALAGDHPWRTIAPLDREPAPRAAVARGNGAVFLAGDAARVVEPFTGEGIYYALRSGELAAQEIVAAMQGKWNTERAAANYRKNHGAMYQGRLWVNRLARAAGRNPRTASLALEVLRWQPSLLGLLTAKVVRS